MRTASSLIAVDDRFNTSFVLERFNKMPKSILEETGLSVDVAHYFLFGMDVIYLIIDDGKPKNV